MWFNDEQFGVITEKGLFIYNLNESLNSPKSCVVWTENFHLENVIFEENVKQIFILGGQGKLRTTKLDNGVETFDSLELVRSDCISIGKTKFKLNNLSTC